jgi:cytoskeletal protein CcmA (bactofilin family)
LKKTVAETAARENNDNVIAPPGGTVLDFSRRDHTADAHEAGHAGKSALRPAIYESPVPPSPGIGSRPLALPPEPMPKRNGTVAPAVASRVDGADAPTRTSAQAAPTPSTDETTVSKLLVGVNIELKGVEISACDIIVVEGHVEATVHSKLMQIAEPGTLKGTALIDVAEVHGEFTGELTARTRLVVHGTGRVSGTIRYGRLIVADGGEISGDVKRLDAAD